MASRSSTPVDFVGETERVAELKAKLEQNERRLEATEEWAEFLETELATREAELEEQKLRNDMLVTQYEAKLAEAKADDDADSGLWVRLSGWLR